MKGKRVAEVKLFGMCICGHIEEEHDTKGCVAEDCVCAGFEPMEEEEESLLSDLPDIDPSIT